MYTIASGAPEELAAGFFRGLVLEHQDRPVSLRDEYTALCAVYTLLRFLWVGWMADREDIAAAVDVTAAAFRLIDHTEFDRYAVPVLRRLGCETWDSLSRLLCL